MHNIVYIDSISDGRIIFDLSRLHTPESHDEIVTIVKDAYTNNHNIRVVAAGHSWSEIAQTQDIMLSLHKYSGLIEVDKENMLVTVKAGTKLRKLSELLDKQDLAMINLGSVAAQSIAGAISTGTIPAIVNYTCSIIHTYIRQYMKVILKYEFYYH